MIPSNNMTKGYLVKLADQWVCAVTVSTPPGDEYELKKKSDALRFLEIGRGPDSKLVEKIEDLPGAIKNIDIDLQALATEDPLTLSEAFVYWLKAGSVVDDYLWEEEGLKKSASPDVEFRMPGVFGQDFIFFSYHPEVKWEPAEDRIVYHCLSMNTFQIKSKGIAV